MPCEIWETASGSLTRPVVEWLWTSMKPGARTRPWPSTTVSSSLGLKSPTSAMCPAATRTFASLSGPPVPSATVAPTITTGWANAA